MHIFAKITAALAIAATLGIAAPLALSHGSDDAPAVTDGESRVAVFAIRGMISPACPIILHAAMKADEGVFDVDADVPTKSARITYDPSQTSPEAIATLIHESAGFGATLVGDLRAETSEAVAQR